jgi:signal transduction histidine kinase
MFLVNFSDIQNIDLLLIGISAAATGLLGLIVYLSDRESSTNKWFLALSIVEVFWVISNTHYQITQYTTNTTILLWLLRIHLFISIWFAYCLLQLFLVFPQKNKLKKNLFEKIVLGIVFCVSILVLTPYSLIEITGEIQPLETPDTTKDIGMLFFGLVSGGLTLSAIYKIFKKWRKAEELEKLQIEIIFLLSIFVFPFILVFNLFLPNILKIFSFIPLGAVLVLIFSGGIVYSIFKYHTLNIKIIATEIFSFIIITISFLQILTASGITDIVLAIIIFVALLSTSIFLIRSVRREVEQREQLAIANTKLGRLNLEKSEFLSIATHQLKAPLTVIKGYVSLLMEGSYGALNDKTKETLTKVFDSAENLIIIIEDFLNVSRIEQGRMTYQFGPIDMKKLLFDIIEELKHIAKQTETTVSLHIQNESEDYTITADYGKIRQVLINLIDNAIKYTGKGFVKTTLEKDDSKKIIRITIKDNGIGMSKATIAKLFQRFSRAKDIGRQAQTKSGSGLGLYIAREMVLAHGGRVWAESPGEGKGSVFFLELPFIPPKNENIEVITNMTTYT